MLLSRRRSTAELLLLSRPGRALAAFATHTQITLFYFLEQSRWRPILFGKWTRNRRAAKGTKRCLIFLSNIVCFHGDTTVTSTVNFSIRVTVSRNSRSSRIRATSHPVLHETIWFTKIGANVRAMWSPDELNPNLRQRWVKEREKVKRRNATSVTSEYMPGCTFRGRGMFCPQDEGQSSSGVIV